MKKQILYRAKSIKIGLIEGSTDCFYLDIVGSDGNQQTVETGTIKNIKAYMAHIKLV